MLSVHCHIYMLARCCASCSCINHLMYAYTGDRVEFNLSSLMHLSLTRRFSKQSHFNATDRSPMRSRFDVLNRAYIVSGIGRNRCRGRGLGGGQPPAPFPPSQSAWARDSGGACAASVHSAGTFKMSGRVVPVWQFVRMAVRGSCVFNKVNWYLH